MPGGMKIYPRKFLLELVEDPAVDLTMADLDPTDIQKVEIALRVVDFRKINQT